MDDETRTHFWSNRQQQIVPRNSNIHPQEMDQAHQISVQHIVPRLTGVSTVKNKFRLQISSFYFFPHTAYGHEQVQLVYSELQKHTDRCKKTNTHTYMLIGGDFNAQVGAIDSKYIGRHVLGAEAHVAHNQTIQAT